MICTPRTVRGQSTTWRNAGVEVACPWTFGLRRGSKRTAGLAKRNPPHTNGSAGANPPYRKDTAWTIDISGGAG